MYIKREREWEGPPPMQAFRSVRDVFGEALEHIYEHIGVKVCIYMYVCMYVCIYREGEGCRVNPKASI